MKIIGIESASLTASAAILDENSLIAEYTMNYKLTHSQTLLPMIAEIVERTALDWEEVSAIAVSGGPGSFTGLRIGVATAKGLGLARKIPVVHVPTLDAMAYSFCGYEGLVCPMLDARRGQVFTGLYRVKDSFEVVKESQAADLKEWLQMLNEMGEPVMLLGDGTAAGVAVIRECLTIPYRIAPAHLNTARAASVAALGMKLFQKGKAVDAAEIAPEYLRVTQAERVRAEKLAAAASEAVDQPGADQAVNSNAGQEASSC